jgi:hypothetical protein
VSKLKSRYPGCVDFLYAKYRVQNPPIKTLTAIIEEATNKEADLLTDDSWNLDYCMNLSLSVRELRVLAEYVEALEKVYGKPTKTKGKEV